MRYLLLALLFTTSALAADIDPIKIVQLSDEVRFPRESFEVEVRIISTGDIPEDRTFKVTSKGNENSIVSMLEPAEDRGQVILMKGRDLWIFMPEVSQAIRLSISQRLTGQVANGDIARANFGGDYNPTLLRTESINGKDYWVLELIAVDKTVAYHKVIYWVDQSNNFPFKAEFYSLSGRMLKTCEYHDFKRVLGRMRPSRLVMINGLRVDSVSTLVYSKMALRDVPDKMFTKDYLNKISGH